MLNLRSSAFNMGLQDAEPFAQYHSRGKPAPHCLPKATVLPLLHSCLFEQRIVLPGKTVCDPGVPCVPQKRCYPVNPFSGCQ
jgi:hypothetical protein